MQTIEFAVSDTGVGIKESFIPKLFDHFSQQDSSKTKEYQGTGLGLFIVKSYVHLLDGAINVSSKEKEGTTIEFTLPLPVTVDTHMQQTKQPIDFGSLGMLDILIAEDNPLNQLLIKKILSERNFRLRIVNNGKEALEAARSDPFDIILMDIQMPVMDGV